MDVFDLRRSVKSIGQGNGGRGVGMLFRGVRIGIAVRRPGLVVHEGVIVKGILSIALGLIVLPDNGVAVKHIGISIPAAISAIVGVEAAVVRALDDDLVGHTAGIVEHEHYQGRGRLDLGLQGGVGQMGADIGFVGAVVIAVGAVLVDTVAAGVKSPRVNKGVVIVTIPVGITVTVPILSLDIIGHGRIAMGVRTGQGPPAVAVVIVIPVDGDQAVVRVDQTVAIVIDAVAFQNFHLGAETGVGGRAAGKPFNRIGKGVVAIEIKIAVPIQVDQVLFGEKMGDRRIVGRIAGKEFTYVAGPSIAVHVPIIGHRVLIDQAVAVIIDPVAQFVGPGMDLGIGVIAVGVVGNMLGVGRGEIPDKNRGVTVTVGVGVLVPVSAALVIVTQAVAIAVDAVANLRGGGIDSGVAIVTIRVVGNITGRRTEIPDNNSGITETVAVGVLVPVLAALLLVAQAVAVIVLTVADLRFTGIPVGVGIIAVIGVGDVTGRLKNGGGKVRGITVTITVSVPVPENAAFVHAAVAVLVNSVAELGHGGIDAGIPVVTIQIIGNITGRLGDGRQKHEGGAIGVAVRVPIPCFQETAFVHVAVAVVVNAVAADFKSPRINCGLGVVTVHVIGGVSVRLHGR